MRGTVLSLSVLLIAASLRADTYRVTSDRDDGSPGTLRWAIHSANDHPGPDSIDFDVFTIRPASPLPPIDGEAYVNSGHGYGDPPQVEIDGSAAGDATGLVIAGTRDNRVSLTNMTVNRFAGNGIEIRGSGAYLQGCRVGTTRDGREAAPNGGDALVVAGDDNGIYSNHFCASLTGIRIRGSQNLLFDNRIGLGANMTLLGNRGDGVVIEPSATGNVVGRVPEWCSLCGPRPSTNYIGANGGNGIVVAGEANSIANNAVGGGYSADPPFGNASNGIVVTGRGNAIAGGEFSFNGENGIVIKSGTDTVVTSPHGMCNGALLIDVDGDGPTPGGPALTAAVSDIAATTIDGSIDARPTTRYTLVVMGTESECGAGLSGRASLPYEVATDASGHAPLHVAFPRAASMITAYLVDPAGMPTEAARIDVVQRSSSIADLGITLTLDRASAMVGDFVTATITITNNGPATVPMVWVTLDLPLGTFVSVTQPPNYEYRALPAGAASTWTYRLRMITTGTLHLTARAKTIDAYTDPDTSNDTADADVSVGPARRRSVGR